MSLPPDALSPAAGTAALRARIVPTADALRDQARSLARAIGGPGETDVALMTLAQAMADIVRGAPADRHADWLRRAQYLVGTAYTAAGPDDI